MAANGARLLAAMRREIDEAKKSIVHEHFALNHAPGANQIPFENSVKINDLFVGTMEQIDQLHTAIVEGLTRQKRVA